MTLINLFGFELPLEWVGVTVLSFLGMAFLLVRTMTSSKGATTQLFVAEFDKNGWVDKNKLIKIKPEQEDLTQLKYELNKKERLVTHYHPLSIPNRKTGNLEKIYLVPENSDRAWNPELAFTEGQSSKSPTRHMQEHASWLGNIRDKIGSGFKIRQHWFLLVAWGGMCLAIGIILDGAYIHFGR